MFGIGRGSDLSSRVSRNWLLVCTVAILVTVGIGVLAALEPLKAALLLVGLIGAAAAFRMGPDAPIIWMLIVPWQFIPGINANILFNPWLWFAIVRILSARRLEDAKPGRIAIGLAVILPASYLIEWLFFGVYEPSLLLWMVPYVPLAVSMIIVPPRISAVKNHLFLAGALTAILTVLESLFSLSSNFLIDSNLSVQEYLRSDRALGTTGNPLFTSSILLVAFFLAPRGGLITRLAQASILAAVVLTGSKSALIGLAAGFLVMAISKGVKRFSLTGAALLTSVSIVQVLADSTSSNVFQRYAVFSDLRTSDPDRAFTTDFVFSWLSSHPLGGTPVGAALIEKRLLSPVNGGSRFGIESTWLAMAADTGLILIGLFLVLAMCHVLSNRPEPIAQALFALIISLSFWNGLYGAWVITPLLLLLILTPLRKVTLDAPPGEYAPEGVHTRWVR